MVQPVPAPAQSPALFGGHRGGGKKREDGLVAGSPEAKAADNEKAQIRMAAKREEERKKKVASLPQTLPSVANPPANAAAPPAADNGAVPVSASGAVTGVGLVPTFVAWSGTMLARPIKLLTKIVDRVRCSKPMERVRKIGCDKETEKEIEQRLRYKQEQLEGFNAALANCAVIELNKRQVPGAQHSHRLELAMTTGVDFLEKKILEKAEKTKAAALSKVLYEGTYDKIKKLTCGEKVSLNNAVRKNFAAVIGRDV